MMCRFVGYFGKSPIFLETLLMTPKNALVKQSYRANEGAHIVNADGFGVAWYDNTTSKNAGVFKSIRPAWNDENLYHLSRKIQSSCFISHIRASTVGGVSRQNCHPFICGQYAFVHNGTIEHFSIYKKSIINQLDDDLFLQIQGNTDSEYFFFLILHFLRRVHHIHLAVNQAIAFLTTLQQPNGHHFVMNMAFTDGQAFFAMRYCSCGNSTLALRYKTQLTPSGQIEALILSSEPLDQCPNDWQALPKNHYLLIDQAAFSLQVLPFTM
jgi:predicted glutamine amidotransferase